MNLRNTYIQLDNRKFTYRQGTSTMLAPTLLKENINNYNEGGSNLHIAFLDFSKAFDKINYYVLLLKLIKKQVHSSLIGVIESMLTNTYVNVSFSGCKGDIWKTRNGTRQGGVLSAFFFCYYIDDLIRNISCMDYGCLINGYRTNILAYADDLVIMAPSALALQSMLNRAYEIICSLSLTLNISKSVYMVCPCKRYKYFKFNPVIDINGTALNMVDQYKYLGVIISNGPVIDNLPKAFKCTERTDQISPEVHLFRHGPHNAGYNKIYFTVVCQYFTYGVRISKILFSNFFTDHYCIGLTQCIFLITYYKVNFEKVE